MRITVCELPMHLQSWRKRAFDAMMKMQKIDVARIEAAVRGEA
jgi:hypothetical protein